MPRRGGGARGTQACLICQHVIFPELALLNVGGTEFPVLCRVINAFEKTRALFVVRLVEEELDDPCAIAVEMLLQIHDGTVSFVPQVFRIEQLSRKTLATENSRMHADDEHVSSALGCLKLKTWQPCGLTPDMTWRMAPSLPAASIPWKMSNRESVLDA